MTDRQRTLAVVLAGGRGTRLGGIDKAWMDWQGQPLIAHLLASLRAQVDAIVVIANSRAARYSALGLRCVADSRPGGLGPLAGLETGMHACDLPWVLSVPVDVPRLPTDLAGRLHAAAVGHAGARACDADGIQPLIALYRRDAVLPTLSAALDSGERAVHRWQAGVDLGQHDWSPARFGNLNSPADLQHERGVQ